MRLLPFRDPLIRWLAPPVVGAASALLLAVTATPGLAQAPADASTGPHKLRVVVMPDKIVPCTAASLGGGGVSATCGPAISDFRLQALIGDALDAAPGIEIAYAGDGYATGKAELKEPIPEDKPWHSGNFGEPEMNYVVRKATELGVDGAILVRIKYDYAEVKGDLFFVDARISRVRSYSFGTYRIGRFNLKKDIGAAVKAMLKDAGMVTGRESIAVLELESENTEPGTALAMGEALRDELRKTERFNVMSAYDMATKFDEASSNSAVCTAVECALSAGKLLGVSKVVAGRVTGIDKDTWKVSVVQVDVATGQTQASESIRHSGSLGKVGKSLAPMADDLAVAASPEGLEFRSDQAWWRWKVGLVAGSAAVLGLAGSYYASKVSDSNEKQKDFRLKAEQATTLADYNTQVQNLKDEKKNGENAYGAAVIAQAASVGLLVWATYAWFHPPELTPVALQIQPSVVQGAAAVAFNYSW